MQKENTLSFQYNLPKQNPNICQVKLQNQPEAKIQTAPKKPTNHKNKKGQWTTDQNLKYLVFLEFHKEKIEQSTKRKAWTYYKMLSSYLGFRDIDQCRSHHHKMMEKYHKLSDLILDLSLRYEEQELKATRKNYLEYRNVQNQQSYSNGNENQSKKIKKQVAQVKGNIQYQITKKVSEPATNLITNNVSQLYYEIPVNYCCCCYQCSSKYWQRNMEKWNFNY